MDHRLLFVAILVSGAAGAEGPAASPADANPGFANPDTPGLLEGKPGDAANAVDVIFIKQLSLGGRAEVELGKLAEERSSSSSIDDFGQRMVKDHSESNAKLASLARSAKVTVPKELTPDQVALREELRALQGKAFDLKYSETQIQHHQKAAQMLIHEIASGQDSRVRQFASDTLPTVMDHLEHAKALHAQLISRP